MKHKLPENLDNLIETALSEEPMRQVPEDLHRRVLDRVQISSMLERERLRFRYAVTGLVCSMMASVALMGFVLLFFDLHLLMDQGISGGKGHFDALAASMKLSWWSQQGVYIFLLALFLTGGGALFSFISMRRYRKSN